MVTPVAGNPPRAGQLMGVVCWSVVGFVVNQLAAAIPITPGGVGFVESGMLSVFVGLGVALPIATVVAVTYRVIVTWMPTLAGVPGLVRPPSAREIPSGDAPASGATT